MTRWPAFRRIAGLAILIALATGCTAAPAAHTQARAPGQYRAAAAVRGYGSVTRTLPPCTAATQPAPELPASDTAMTTVQSPPFGVSVSSDDRLAFVDLRTAIGVFRIGRSGAAVLVHTVGAPATFGSVLVPGDRYLLPRMALMVPR